jgi:co-chaperonin GroES (HSP10)
MDVEKYSVLTPSELKVFGDVILVIPLIRDKVGKILVPEVVQQPEAKLSEARGRAVYVGDKVTNVKFRDIVHFNQYGRYDLVQHQGHGYIVLHERDIIAKEIPIEQPEPAVGN